MRSRPRAALAACLAAAGAIGAIGLGAQADAVAPSEVQGSGARSPYEGAVVTTTGVVTGRKSNGFFLQAPDGAGDGVATTSDALFVFTSAAPPPNVTAGTLVAVTGRVLEFAPASDPTSPPLTELTEISAIDIRGAGMTLPAPVDLGAVGVDRREALEGMRVRVATLTTVSGTLGSVNEANATGTSSGVFYGVLPGVPRPFRRRGISVDQAIPSNVPCCVPVYDGSPERVRVDSDGLSGAAAMNVPTGATIRNLVGPLDFAFRAYTVLPDPGVPPQVEAPTTFAGIDRPGDDELAVASLNLQRFYDTTDDPSVGDAVLTAVAFQNRLRKTALYVRRRLYLPHLIGVQEAENLATLRALAEAINREAREARELKTRYEAYLEEGNDPSGIDVGVLVDRARVDVLSVVQEGRGEQFRGPSGTLEFLHDRPPLVLRARVTWPVPAPRPITVVVAHMRSLIDVDSPTAGARVRLKRGLQAESLAAMIDRRLAVDPAEPLLVVGDMNAFEFSDGFVDVVGTVRGVPPPRDEVVQSTRDLLAIDLANLLDLLAPADRYSYVFDGVAQTIDHMLASPGLVPLVAAFGYVRGNADAPETWRSDATRPERISDHDAALAYLRSPR